ncbi:MAG: pentapeptide repeat-containing protein [Chloroflexi bacterium]|nr:pentapeptide repeat-containing protein [Chloroflexota bacterium]
MERLIEVNGGAAKGLNLSFRNLEGIFLSDASLQGANFVGANLKYAQLVGADFKDADLSEINLAEADLREANLEGVSLLTSNLYQANLEGANLKGAALGDSCLYGANLENSNLCGAFLPNTDIRSAHLEYAEISGANLDKADLQDSVLYMANLHGANLGRTNLCGANLLGSDLRGTDLWHVQFSQDTNLEEVNWGPDCQIDLERKGLNVELAASTYRALKLWYINRGIHDVAGKFHYREWECKRKLAQQEKTWGETVLLWLYRLVGGYGEFPGRVIGVGAAVIAMFAAWYFPYSGLPCFQGGCWAGLWEGIWQSLYFSGVSFTALGYGFSETIPDGWTRYLGVVESLVGISLIALFLVTFTRKMTR